MLITYETFKAMRSALDTAARQVYAANSEALPDSKEELEGHAAFGFLDAAMEGLYKFLSVVDQSRVDAEIEAARVARGELRHSIRIGCCK